MRSAQSGKDTERKGRVLILVPSLTETSHLPPSWNSVHACPSVCAGGFATVSVTCDLSDLGRPIGRTLDTWKGKNKKHD
jgi:hypothetical protein